METRNTSNAMVDEGVERECTHFLYREAELLDNRKFDEWLSLLSPAIDYRVPVRTTRENKDGFGFSKSAFFLEEDFGSIKVRVARLRSEFAWSENPATRTRRFVGNIRVRASDTPGSAKGEERYAVVSNMAVFCYRGEEAKATELTGERHDVLQRIDGEWKLLSRTVLLDATVLGMESLSIFL
jgi:3-phenylpropionate/cinnamic acid dioxygenase small subunit